MISFDLADHHRTFHVTNASTTISSLPLLLPSLPARSLPQPIYLHQATTRLLPLLLLILLPAPALSCGGDTGSVLPNGSGAIDSDGWYGSPYQPSNGAWTCPVLGGPCPTWCPDRLGYVCEVMSAQPAGGGLAPASAKGVCDKSGACVACESFATESSCSAAPGTENCAWSGREKVPKCRLFETPCNCNARDSNTASLCVDKGQAARDHSCGDCGLAVPCALEGSSGTLRDRPSCEIRAQGCSWNDGPSQTCEGCSCECSGCTFNGTCWQANGIDAERCASIGGEWCGCHARGMDCNSLFASARLPAGVTYIESGAAGEAACSKQWNCHWSNTTQSADAARDIPHAWNGQCGSFAGIRGRERGRERER